MRKHILQCIILYAVIFLCKPNAASMPKNLHVSQLSNGLQTFVNEVPSSAMIHVDFLCRAGYGAQDNSNAGFLELYSRLFLSTAKAEPVLDYVPVTYKSNADRVIYSCDVTQELFDSYIRALSKCLTQPSFSEQDIQEHYESMKKRISAYQNSDAGFINSAIEAKVCPDTPWKQSFGINNTTFSSYTIEQIKSMLLSVHRNYYTPDNCAFFITGNISSTVIEKAIEKYLSEWSGSYTGSQRRTQGSYNDYSSSQKKFVLTSPDFSSDITQIAVQFTGLSKNETLIINEIFNSSDSPYKISITQEPALAVRSKEYLSSSCTNESTGARLILQSMMEQPYSIIKQKKAPKITVAEQADMFTQMIKKSCNVEENKYTQAKNNLYTTFLSQSGANKNLQSLMEDFWTTHPYIQAKDLYETLMQDGHDIQTLSKDEIVSHVTKEEPFVFVMINDSTYKKNKNSFSDKGYTLITKNDDAWYKNNSYSISSNNTSQANYEEEELFSYDSYSKYYIDNVRTISSAKLSNGIPITSKTIKDSQTVLTSISIAGGESQSPSNHKKLRTLLVNASAEYINTEIKKSKSAGKITGEVKILSWTTEAYSYITIECQKNELKEVLSCAAKVFFNTDLDPLTIDYLIGEQKYQWKRQTGDFSYQLKSKAIESLYKGTIFEQIYNIPQNSDILTNTNFQTVLLSYSKLKDANLYSIVFTGDIDIKTAKKEAELTFGLLEPQKKTSIIEIPSPHIDKSEIKVKTQQTYFGLSSNIMQLYFPSPSSASQMEMFNAVLFELAKLIKEDLKEGYDCLADGATATLQIGKLECTGLLQKSNFVNSYINARKKLISELEDSEKSALRLARIRNTWSYKTLIKTQTNEGTAQLIQDSIISGSPHIYLESYLFVSNAKGGDFISILNKYFPETPPLKVFSSELKD